MSHAREWIAFAGALFSLMGLSLSAAARRNAEDALAWQREWRHAMGIPEPREDDGPRRRRIELAYRLAGLFFIGVGLGLFWSAGTGTFLALGGGGRDALVGGTLIAMGGVVMAFNAWRSRPLAPRFMEGRLIGDDEPVPLGERVAAACTNAIIALMLAFGLRLLREGLR